MPDYENMPDYEVPGPILNSPFEEPAWHWNIEEGVESEKCSDAIESGLTKILQLVVRNPPRAKHLPEFHRLRSKACATPTAGSIRSVSIRRQYRKPTPGSLKLSDSCWRGLCRCYSNYTVSKWLRPSPLKAPSYSPGRGGIAAKFPGFAAIASRISGCAWKKALSSGCLFR